jgi:hypothetical protein
LTPVAKAYSTDIAVEVALLVSDTQSRIGDEDLEPVQTWDNGKFDEIDLDRWVRSNPNYLLANNFAGVPESTVAKMKGA